MSSENDPLPSVAAIQVLRVLAVRPHWSWYQLDRYLSTFHAPGPYWHALDELKTRGLMLARPSDRPSQPTYEVTSTGLTTLARACSEIAGTCACPCHRAKAPEVHKVP